jgi:hypothetical protein
VSAADRLAFIEKHRCSVFPPWRVEKRWMVRVPKKADYWGDSLEEAIDAAMQ